MVSTAVSFLLMQAYESLALLEGTSRMAQQALASGRSARMNSRDAQNLSAYFNKVSAAYIPLLLYCLTQVAFSVQGHLCATNESSVIA